MAAFNGYGMPRLDFSPLAKLGDVYQEGKTRGARSGLAGLGDVSPEELSKALLAAGDFEGGMTLAKLADARGARALAQSNADRSHQLQRDQLTWQQEQPLMVGSAETGYHALDRRTLQPLGQGRTQQPMPAPGATPVPGVSAEAPAGPQPLIPPKAKAPKDLTAGDRKAIFEAEDENDNLKSTVQVLNAAKELNAKTFTGVTAGPRGFIGANVPGGGLIIDKDAATATVEWQKLMEPEALKTMASTLKGATTDFELRTFIKQLADPTTPIEVRGRIIERMLQLSERKAQTNQMRMDQLRGGTYYKPGGGRSPQLESPAVPGAKPVQTQTITAPKLGELRDGYRYKGGDPASPDSWVKAK